MNPTTPFAPPQPNLPPDAAKKLRSALHLPASDPLIAHWLFSNKHQLFHTDAPLLPPATFSSSLTLHLEHNYTPSNLSDRATDATLPPTNSSEASSAAAVDMLFLPALRLSGVVLGYTITRGAAESRLGGGEESLLRGRFAASEDGTHAVNVTHGISKGASGVVGMHASADGSLLVRHFFTVPNESYSFERLPRVVLALLENVEYRVGGCLGDAGREGSTVSDSDASERMSADVEGSSGTGREVVVGPRMPFTAMADGRRGKTAGGNPFDWFDTRQRVGNDGRQVVVFDELRSYREGRSNEGEGDRLDLRAIGMTLKRIQDTVSGSFYGPRVCTDLMDRTGFVVYRRTGEMRARIGAVCPRRRQGLVEIGAFSYYAAVLSASSGSSLGMGGMIESGEQRRAEDIVVVETVGEEEDVRSKESETSKRPRAKKIAPSMTAMPVEYGTHVEMLETTEQERMAAKREAKKRYNRLSAAKSNVRKKERVAKQEAELKGLRERKVQLEMVAEKLREENCELRRQCGMAP